MGAVPVPVSDWTAGELVALLANERLAEVAPLACGVKLTVNGADEPAASVTGSEMPESANSLFVLPADEIVTEAPVALRVPFKEELVATVTFPKFNVAGETANWPGVVPVPDRARLSGELEASDTILSDPLTDPAPAGAKVRVKVTLWFAFSVVGTVKPLKENPTPLMFACEMETAVPPVLVKVSDLLLLLAT